MNFFLLGKKPSIYRFAPNQPFRQCSCHRGCRLPSLHTWPNEFPSHDARRSGKAVVALQTALFTYKVQGIEDGEDLPLHREQLLLEHCGHPATSWSSGLRSAVQWGTWSLETARDSFDQCARFQSGTKVMGESVSRAYQAILHCTVMLFQTPFDPISEIIQGTVRQHLDRVSLEPWNMEQ